MKTDDLILLIIYKLYNNLNNFYKDIESNEFIISELNSHKDIIEQKYNDFNDEKNNNTKEYVKNILINIFDKYKEKIIKNFLEFDNFINKNNEIGF